MTSTFATINQAYNATFTPNRLSVGLVLPIEKYTTSPIPDMTHHLERAQLAERLGFAALWLRDVPFNVPSFGDAGQMFDPFVYLGFLAARTQTIALATGSIIFATAPSRPCGQGGGDNRCVVRWAFVDGRRIW